MKYCEDCKWCITRNGEKHLEIFECSNEGAFFSGENAVTRHNKPWARYCRQYGPCDIEGKLWEAKE
jgi:hypothetical protein